MAVCMTNNFCVCKCVEFMLASCHVVLTIYHTLPMFTSFAPFEDPVCVYGISIFTLYACNPNPVKSFYYFFTQNCLILVYQSDVKGSEMYKYFEAPYLVNACRMYFSLTAFTPRCIISGNL